MQRHKSFAVFGGSSDVRTPRAKPGLTRDQRGSLLLISDGASRALGDARPMSYSDGWKWLQALIAGPEAYPSVPRARHDGSGVLRSFRAGSHPTGALGDAFAR